ncbi:ribonuclease P protein component [Jannaschia sp. R86511]|uniref:ribonuclease P protein component n=1 Tax=Jannaschia sp. R86511 TaxID=3093853 RepID=UPI0036D37B3F
MALPADRRLRRGADITAAVRRGSRARSGGLVVHGLRRAPVAPGPTRDAPAAAGTTGTTLSSGSTASAVTSVTRREPGGTGSTQVRGPRIAFVAPRAVGSAVRRNRTRRRLQAHLTGLVAGGALSADVDLVLRLLPASTDADSAALGHQLDQALRRLGVLTDERA